MALPRRLTFSILEAAARWACTPADIIEWSISGHIEITSVIPLATANAHEISGLMAIPAEEVMHIFRRDGCGYRTAQIRRVRTRSFEGQWLRITEPADGIAIGPFDVMITSDEIDRFERDNNLLPKSSGHKGGAAAWDWDGFYSALILRIHNHGIPERQSELVDEMTGWFERRSDTGKTPDPSTIRKKIAAVWRDITEA